MKHFIFSRQPDSDFPSSASECTTFVMEELFKGWIDELIPMHLLHRQLQDFLFTTEDTPNVTTALKETITQQLKKENRAMANTAMEVIAGMKITAEYYNAKNYVELALTLKNEKNRIRNMVEQHTECLRQNSIITRGN